jgi:hypothetical protein
VRSASLGSRAWLFCFWRNWAKSFECCFVQGCQIFLSTYNIPERGKIYQMIAKLPNAN